MEFNKGGLEMRELHKIYKAQEIIERMFVPPSYGFMEGGKCYEYIGFIYNKKTCLSAVKTLTEFIEKFAPDFDELTDVEQINTDP